MFVLNISSVLCNLHTISGKALGGLVTVTSTYTGGSIRMMDTGNLVECFMVRVGVYVYIPCG